MQCDKLTLLGTLLITLPHRLPDMIGHKASMCTFCKPGESVWAKLAMLWQILVLIKRRRVPLFMVSLSGILLCPWMGDGETFRTPPLQNDMVHQPNSIALHF